MLLELSDRVDTLVESDRGTGRNALAELRDALSSNTRVSHEKLAELIEYVEHRKRVRRIKELVDKILAKRGLVKGTGKKLALLAKSTRLAKSRSLKALKMARAKRS